MASPEESLAREMIELGIPEDQTPRIMSALLIWSIVELKSLTHERLMNVDRIYWQQIVDLRNAHAGLRATLMYVCVGV